MYKPYDTRVHYVAISASDRHPDLRYAATIHHGLDPQEFPVDLAGSDDLLYFGRIHPDKGTREAIDVARATGRRLHIYGLIQDQAYFNREIQPHVDGERITFHGPVGGAERQRALGKAYALLHLINFDEPFGLSVIEAMASGTPVIAKRRGSMPELIDHGYTGFLVKDMEEAIAAVGQIGTIDRRATSATVARRFSVDRMVREYIALYQQIITMEGQKGEARESRGSYIL
jgi:glycosyltransferase involved in cell wall biosynthesis